MKRRYVIARAPMFMKADGGLARSKSICSVLSSELYLCMPRRLSACRRREIVQTRKRYYSGIRKGNLGLCRCLTVVQIGLQSYLFGIPDIKRQLWISLQCDIQITITQQLRVVITRLVFVFDHYVVSNLKSLH